MNWPKTIPAGDFWTVTKEMQLSGELQDTVFDKEDWNTVRLRGLKELATYELQPNGDMRLVDVKSLGIEWVAWEKVGQSIINVGSIKKLQLYDPDK